MCYLGFQGPSPSPTNDGNPDYDNSNTIFTSTSGCGPADDDEPDPDCPPVGSGRFTQPGLSLPQNNIYRNTSKGEQGEF